MTLVCVHYKMALKLKMEPVWFFSMDLKRYRQIEWESCFLEGGLWDHGRSESLESPLFGGIEGFSLPPTHHAIHGGYLLRQLLPYFEGNTLSPFKTPSCCLSYDGVSDLVAPLQDPIMPPMLVSFSFQSSLWQVILCQLHPTNLPACLL